MRLVRVLLRLILIGIIFVGVILLGIQHGLHVRSRLARLIRFRAQRRKPEVIVEVPDQRGVVLL
jgi:hypothetical protein